MANACSDVSWVIIHIFDKQVLRIAVSALDFKTFSNRLPALRFFFRYLIE
ncbi:hypothetical protein SMIM3IV_01861 [Streptococcus mitis]|uniref:Uncharacterized protein n=1 Tax=Streptococcus mitis TaxID=28037 RepID=A0A150NV97_STRMT|nr:hypothetical protein SMIM3I_02112 [Streptococcus mitis]KYF37391.1 hypothetical protein SMIM3IV_01861 [Streptococcus mitis]QBX08904.1 hypothetical protein JavanS300_0012 [Streptococcus satellite phage Javan300]QBX09102.1 hypothetical protein JavanS317_0014 [Streptococcus satellite phage Javan317]